MTPDQVLALRPILWAVILCVALALAWAVRAWWTGPIVRELRGLREDLKRRKP